MKKLNNIMFIICFFLFLMIYAIPNIVYAALSSSLKLEFPPVDIGGIFEYNPTMYIGTLDVMIELNGKTLMRQSTDNYENAKTYLIEHGYVPENISQEDLISYVESHANLIKVHITNLNYFEVIDSALPLPGTDSETSKEPIQEDINTEDYKPTENISSERLTAIAQNVIGVIQIIGTVLSVIIIIIIGIKYLIGSVEERAEYKKTALLYIIGAVLLFCTVTIVRIIYDLTSELF